MMFQPTPTRFLFSNTLTTNPYKHLPHFLGFLKPFSFLSVNSSSGSILGSAKMAVPNKPFSLPSNSNPFMGFRRVLISRTHGPLKKKSIKFEEAHFRSLASVKRCSPFRYEASTDSLRMTQELTINKPNVKEIDDGSNPFMEMKSRFLTFKRQKYLENLDHYQKLAKDQAPKFMVIACADSRVCPSTILGFEPGEAFVVRNVGNMVPSFENGPSETNAALEFAVNSLEVQNILVIGHSCCGGIQALMGMRDEMESRSFIGSWVANGKNASLSTKAVVDNLSFDQQCRHCEKVSINCSLLNLLSYPWIEERASKGLLSIHGGYYDFTNCTFEKWTLDYRGSSFEQEGCKHAIKYREFWS